MKTLSDSHTRNALAFLPDSVKELAKNHFFWIGGGFLRATCPVRPRKDWVADIDLFFNSEEGGRAFAWALCLHHVSSGQTVHIDQTRAAITIRCPGNDPIQIVMAWRFSDSVDLLEHFDFTVTQAVMWWHQSLGVWQSQVSDAFYPDIEAAQLVFTGSDCPLQSLWRTYKYRDKGYTVSQQEMGKMIATAMHRVTERMDENNDITSVVSTMLGEYID